LPCSGWSLICSGSGLNCRWEKVDEITDAFYCAKEQSEKGQRFVLKSYALQNRRPPIDLSARLAVCDANYLRLRKLLPEFHAGLTRTILLPVVGTEATGEHKLELHVLESFRYTTTLDLKLLVEEAAPEWFKTPRLTVRLYHDAETAEVITYQDQRSFKAVYQEDEAPRFSWDEKNQINLFLAEWLTLCLEGGLGYLCLPACLRPAESATEAPAIIEGGK
jgi:uncharacterized protein